jgi:N-acetylmuramoyl-L-alanine amidase
VSHPEEGKYLDSNKGKEEIATSISKAIVSYKNDFFNPDASERNTESNSVISDDHSNSKTDNSSDSDKDKSSNTYYKVQISAGRKKIATKPSNFKGLKEISFEKEKKIYKYFYGKETDFNACKKKLEEAKRKGYTSAFIVTFTN